MVSKASEDLPEPERPVNTTSWSRGMSRSTFLRLCSRAPRIAITRRSGRVRLWAWELSFMRNKISLRPGGQAFERRGLGSEHSENAKQLPVRVPGEGGIRRRKLAVLHSIGGL